MKRWRTGTIKGHVEAYFKMLRRQRSQRKPGVRVREKSRSRCYLMSLFHILLLLNLLELSTGAISSHRAFRAKFVSPMYKHTTMLAICYGTIYTRILKIPLKISRDLGMSKKA